MLPDLPPAAWAVIGIVVAALVAYQRSLGWQEYQTIHRAKRRLLPFVDRLGPWFVVSDKGGRDDAEYVATVSMPARAVYEQLRRDGFSPHLVNSIKRRPHPETGDPQYTAAHLVQFHPDQRRDTQTEVYLFANAGPSTDVYAHHETSVREGEDHLTDTRQVDGDPEGTLPSWVHTKTVEP